MNCGDLRGQFCLDESASRPRCVAFHADDKAFDQKFPRSTNDIRLAHEEAFSLFSANRHAESGFSILEIYDLYAILVEVGGILQLEVWELRD